MGDLVTRLLVNPFHDGRSGSLSETSHPIFKVTSPLHLLQLLLGTLEIPKTVTLEEKASDYIKAKQNIKK
jgi:hypothetical protein